MPPKNNILFLSNEILLKIIFYVQLAAPGRTEAENQDPKPDVKALIALSQTCRRLQPLSEFYLYRTIHLDPGSRAKSFVASLNRAYFSISNQVLSSRLNFVRNLYMDSLREGTDAKDDLRHSILSMKSLKKLAIAERVNLGQNRMHDVFWIDVQDRWTKFFVNVRSTGSLNTLKSLTITWSGPFNWYWGFTEAESIFTLPSLTELALSSLDLGDLNGGSGDPPVRSRSLPLTHLTLTNVRLSEKGIQTILSLPRGLQAANIAPIRRSQTIQFCDLEADEASILTALHQQCQSLKSFTYTAPACGPSWPAAGLWAEDLSLGGMADFTALENLTLNGPVILLYTWITSACAPSNLTHVSLGNLNRHEVAGQRQFYNTTMMQSGVPDITVLIQNMPRLRQYTLVFPEFDVEAATSPGSCENFLFEMIKDLDKRCERLDVELEIWEAKVPVNMSSLPVNKVWQALGEYSSIRKVFEKRQALVLDDGRYSPVRWPHLDDI